MIKEYFYIFGIVINNKTSNIENQVLDTIIDFRDEVRKYAFSNKQFDLLTLTDKIRDIDLPKLDITIEDTSKTTSKWRFNN